MTERRYALSETPGILPSSRRNSCRLSIGEAGHCTGQERAYILVFTGSFAFLSEDNFQTIIGWEAILSKMFLSEKSNSGL